MKKIIVIGCPGSGKSTFARALHHKMGIPICHLDTLFWNADKTAVEKSVFRERLTRVLEMNAWIIDGNYASTMEIRMAACDTVFFLDYPTDVCLAGVKARIGKPRGDMPWIESEEDAEFIGFIKTFRKEQRPEILALLDKYSDKNIVVFKSRADGDAFLKKEFDYKGENKNGTFNR